LLKVFSRILDEDKAAGKPPPRRLLDSGCGCGVIGICAAKAITTNDARIRCQDRDELARLLTLHNAAKNGVPPAALEACTEPLLAGPDSGRWDMILTNIPAKAGTPILEDFVRRSAAMLNPGGRVIMVAVHPLADFFRERIAADAELVQEHKSPGHTVFVYGGKAEQAPAESPVNAGPGFFARYPFYARAAVTCQIEDIPVYLETIHGASGFDQPGGAVLAAARLIARLKKTVLRQLPLDGSAPLLVHEPGQGFFPCWMIELLCGKSGLPLVQEEFLTTEVTELHGGNRDCCSQSQRERNTQCFLTKTLVPDPRSLVPISSSSVYSVVNSYSLDSPIVLSGRNILALEASRHNVERHNAAVSIVSVADLSLGRAALLEASGGRQYSLIVAFPELVPQSSLPKTAKGSQGTSQLTALWDALPPLLADGGVFIAAFASAEAERFDRKKPAGVSRLAGVKRNGFRALGYQKTSHKEHKSLSSP